MKLLIIGGGNMGGAMVRACMNDARATAKDGACSKGLFESVTVVDSHAGKLEEFKKMGCEVATSLEGGAMTDTMILLAVKPQDIDVVLAELKALVDGALLVSIAAGVSMERLVRGSGCEAVVRVMPNTPAQIGLGATGWMAGAGVSQEQKKTVAAFLELMGVAVEVESEDELDAVTALSGCGPAYVFYFMEALIEGAGKLGLSKEAAGRLAVQTVKGAAALAESATTGDGADGDSVLEALQTLRAKVTSKGGTTEQAVGVLEEAAFKATVHNAMRAAYERAREMR